jgi:hypothetical protein
VTLYYELTFTGDEDALSDYLDRLSERTRSLGIRVAGPVRLQRRPKRLSWRWSAWQASRGITDKACWAIAVYPGYKAAPVTLWWGCNADGIWLGKSVWHSPIAGDLITIYTKAIGFLGLVRACGCDVFVADLSKPEWAYIVTNCL